MPVERQTAREADKRNKEVILKNCTSCTDCMSKMNNTEVDIAKNLDIVLPVCSLIEYSDNSLKTSGSLWQFYRDEPGKADKATMTDFKNSNLR